MNTREPRQNMPVVALSLATLGVMPSSSEMFDRWIPEMPAQTERGNGRVPNVSLVTHEGKRVRFYDDLIKDKVVLINFMYARCPAYCRSMTVNLRKVCDEFGDRMGREVFMYSVTLEPEHDSPEVLKSYSEAFNTGRGWTFLTGRKNDIEAVCKSLSVVNEDPQLDKDLTRHLGMLRYGHESLDRWAGMSALTNPKKIAEYVHWVEPGRFAQQTGLRRSGNRLG